MWKMLAPALPCQLGRGARQETGIINCLNRHDRNGLNCLLELCSVFNNDHTCDTSEKPNREIFFSK